MSDSNMTRKTVLEKLTGDSVDEIRFADDEGSEGTKETEEDNHEMEQLCADKSVSTTTKLIKGVDCDDESGVYLGPGLTFDDEDLDYLNKDENEDQQRLLHPSPPSSLLVVDSVSGIYLGFDETLTDDEDTEEEDAPDKSGNEDTKACENETQLAKEENKPNSMWKMLQFRSKQSSKYKMSQETDREGNICFRFLRRVWGKAEMCP